MCGVPSYNLTIQVADNAPNTLGAFPAGTLFDTVAVRVVVGNVNDLTVTAASRTTFGTGGSQSITFTGTNFGFVVPRHPPVVTATYAQATEAGYSYTATGCQVATGGNTQITCTTAAGVGANLFWTLTVNGERVTSTIATAYIAPVITGVSQATVSPTTGGRYVNITGTNLGNNAAAISVVYSRTITYNAASCVVVTPNTYVSCQTVAGAGSSHEFKITVGGQSSPWSGVTAVASYAAPVVTAIAAPALSTEVRR